MNKALSRVKAVEMSPRPTIRIGTSLLSPSKLIMSLLAPIQQLHTDFQFKIVPFEDENTKIIQLLSSLGKNIDIVVGPYSETTTLGRFNTQKLGNCKICVAVPRTHQLACREVIRCEDLGGENLMMFKRGGAEQLDTLRDMLQERYPEITLTDTNFTYDYSVFNDCEESNSVLLTLDIWEDVHPALVTIPVAWDHSLPFGIFYPSNPSKEIQSFLEIVQMNIAE